MRLVRSCSRTVLTAALCEWCAVTSQAGPVGHREVGVQRGCHLLQRRIPPVYSAAAAAAVALQQQQSYFSPLRCDPSGDVSVIPGLSQSLRLAPNDHFVSPTAGIGLCQKMPR